MSADWILCPRVATPATVERLGFVEQVVEVLLGVVKVGAFANISAA